MTWFHESKNALAPNPSPKTCIFLSTADSAASPAKSAQGGLHLQHAATSSSPWTQGLIAWNECHRDKIGKVLWIALWLYVFSLTKLQVHLENTMLRGLCASSCLTFKHASNFKHINSSIHFTGIILVRNFQYVLKWFSKLCSQKASEAPVTMNVMGQLESNCPVETSLFCVKTTRSILLQFKEKSQFLRISHVLACRIFPLEGILPGALMSQLWGYIMLWSQFKSPQMYLSCLYCPSLCISSKLRYFLKTNKKTFSHCFQEISVEPSAE